MSRVGRIGLSGAAGAALLILGACTPPPPVAPVRSGPVLADCASAGAASTAAVDAAEASNQVGDDPAGGASAGLNIVALDDAGRPEILPTTAALVGATSATLDADRDLDVVAVEPDREMTTGTAPGTGEPRRAEQWSLDDLAIEPAWATSRGAGVDIAVVDSGVAGTHVDLASKLCSGVAFLGSDGIAQRGAGAVDTNGHGTHVAGIAAAAANGVGVAGVAPDARLMPVRVLDAAGTGSSSDVARGITWAVDHGAEVINLSLGGPRTAAVDAAVAYAETSGVVVVAAAGNDGPGGAANYPAALDTAVAVGSYDENQGVSWFSTLGEYVDLAAPGSGILSTTKDGRWSYMSGTSMATPHVAATAALLLAAEPTLSPSQVRARLTANARDAGPIGHDTGYGWGRLDPVAALGG